MAQVAEAAGFDAFFRSDHFLTMGGDGLPGPTDSWITLGAIARETDRIRLGTLVTSGTFRPPGLLAVQVAQVDAMSRGASNSGSVPVGTTPSTRPTGSRSRPWGSASSASRSSTRS